MKLHERLRELRTECGLFLQDVAELSGISRPYISDLERGRTNPSLDTLNALASAYGITVRQLLEAVEFGQVSRVSSLPRGLSDLKADPVLGAEVTADWVEALARVEHNGKRPRTSGEYYEIFTHLRRILAPEEVMR